MKLIAQQMERQYPESRGFGAVVLGVAALLANYISARRAVSVNPVEALRAK
jgi:hypothetical protein